jgi:predicted  nucleic acid-binding Zn-ribbon protein
LGQICISNAEAEELRSEMSRIRVRIEEVGCEIKKANHKIAQVRDDIGEEKDIRSSKGENQAFYAAVSRNIAKLEWELDKHYVARTDLIDKLKALRGRRDKLCGKLEDG